MSDLSQPAESNQSGQPDDLVQTNQAGQTSQTNQAGQTGQTNQAGQTGQTNQAGQAGLTGQAGQTGQTNQAGQTGQTNQAGQAGLTGQFPDANPASQSGHSGQPMPVGDLPGWHQIFAEDFNINVPLGHFPGGIYGSKFTVYPDGTPDTAGQQGRPSMYYPSKVISVQNSILNLYLHQENGKRLAAAILPNLPGSNLYGKYTIRFRSDPVLGFKTAWLLWPKSENWPHDGEVDFPEGDLSSNIGGFVHHQYATSGSDQSFFSTAATYPSWHTSSIEWYPNQIHFILDGKTIGISSDRVPCTPMSWVIQTESSLGNGTATTSGNLQIDWAVAYTLVH